MIRRRLFFILAAFAAAAQATCHAAEPRTYNFSPVNQWNLQVTGEFWNPIAQYVSGKSGVNLMLKLGRTSADTTSYVLAHEVDFAFTNHMFSPERQKMGWKVFGRREAPGVYGQIVVPADSPVYKLTELAGHEVAFPGPEAFLAYKTTYGHLLELNIPVKVVFAGNLDAAFSQLFSGRVKAMGSNSQMVVEYAKRENRRFRTLWTSPLFHDLALMASPRVPEGDLKAVAAAFLNMHKDPAGHAILVRVADVVKSPVPLLFVPATDAEYQSYRDFYRNLPAALR